AQLFHPNVVQLLTAGRSSGKYFVTMEYIEGGSDLTQVVGKSGPLPVAQACDYVRQAALGLQQAHERDLVHRAIKPSSLLIAPTGQVVKILGLGLSCLRGPTGNGEFGTRTIEAASPLSAAFLAPEQESASGAVDIRADLYSLGVVFYYSLTG